MQIADAQGHIWLASSPDREWTTAEGSSRHPRAEFGYSELLAEMDAAGVARCVLVPPSYEGDRNDYVIEAARSHPDRFAVQARLDLTRVWRRDELQSLMADAAVKGIRLTFNGSARRRLVDGDLGWLWPMAAEQRVPVSLYPWSASAEYDSGEWAAVLRLAEMHPELVLGIDHFGVGQWVDSRTIHAALKPLRDLARMPNVSLKASSLSVIARDSSLDPEFVSKVMRPLVEWFGPARLFWGSDRTRATVDYREEIDAFIEGLSFLTRPEVELVMGKSLTSWLDW